MKIIKTSISGLVLIEPKVYNDSRGYFFEPYNKKQFDNLITKTDFVQDNESKSRKGVLRGLHFQKPPFDQAKLVRCIEGEVLDVAVDLRKNLNPMGNMKRLFCLKKIKTVFIPRGFAHAFLVLSDTAIFSYKVDNFYAPDYDCGILWNDPTINIDWGLNKEDLIISNKDKNLPLFSNLKSPF